MNSYCLSNIIQSELWKHFSNFHNKIVLPLIIYYNEFETNNPLGSHVDVHKVRAIYFSLSPEVRSKFDNIFLTFLNTEVYGNEVMFRPFIFFTKKYFYFLEKSESILADEGENIFFIAQCMDTIRFCSHVQSYEVKYLNSGNV